MTPILRPIIEDATTRREMIRQKVVEGLTQSFPLKAGKHTVELSNVRIEPKSFSSLDQKRAVLEGNTLSERVRGDLTVKDATGSAVDHAKDFTLLQLPWFTPRHTFIVDGTEYAVANQIRTKPGAYVRRRGNEELQTTFNLSKGANFHITMNPEKGLLYMQPTHGTSQIPLHPILRALGVPQQDIAAKWGSEIASMNRDAWKNPDKHVDKLYETLVHPSKQTAATGEEKSRVLREYFDNTSMDPEVSMRTLDYPYDKASPAAILAASQKLLNVHRAAADVDDRDSLAFKTFHSVDDFTKERLMLEARAMRAKLGWKLDANGGKLRGALPAGAFTRAMHGFLTGSSLSRVPMQINPMELLDQASQVTMLGEGAISSDRAIPLEARDVHPTHLGILDSARTPESFSVGADLRAAIGARRDDKGNLYAPVYDVAAKKSSFLKAGDMHKAVIAFPGESLAPGKLVDAMRFGEVARVPSNEVTHQIEHVADLYGPTTNLLPLVYGIQGNRVLMASKHQGQALPLVHREAPLVQAESWMPGVSMERELVKQIVPTAREAGVVTSIDEHHIHIGPEHKAAADETKLHYDQNFPLAAKTMLHNTLLVKPGDHVEKGQLLAESNFTKDGTLALGTNLRVGYMSYRGLNANDGIVMSQSGADKLTSEHMYQHGLAKDGGAQLGREKHRAYFGSRYTKEQYDKLDDDGLVKPGVELHYGDPIAVGVRENKATGDALLLGKLSKSLVKPYAEVVELWQHQQPGTVVDTAKTNDRVAASIRTTEKMQLGDKASNRYGGKGVVTAIVPDHQMIQDAQGRPLDLLYTSAGVVSRINPAQIIETALGKVAEKTGKPIVVPQYTPGRDNVQFARDLLKEHGLSDKETVLDPMTGRHIPNVMVGKSYILKLMKTTDTNWSAHGGGDRYDYNQQPARGGDEGAKGIGKMELDGLIAHNARNILREAASIKSQRNDEFWRAVQLGMPTPAPKSPFAYDKLLGMLTGAGVKVTKTGTRLALGPLTDKDVTSMSSGALDDPSKLIRAKDLRPETGGLFDPTKTGGMSGTKWSHVNLHEPIVNPVFEEPVRRLLGLTQKEFNEHVGKGGEWFKSALGEINVDDKIEELRAQTKRMRGPALDGVIKQIKYLEALKERGVKPADAYVVSKVPVTPPILRPILPLRDGRLQVGDANLLMKDAFLANDQLKAAAKDLPSSELHAPRTHLYDAVSALYGVGEPVSPGAEKRGAKGYLASIAGTRPGSGFFQAKLLKRQQDVSARGTAAPDPTLSMDEVGIPRDMLYNMYGKFVVGRMVRRGYSATDAQKMLDDGHPIAHEELVNEARERPVLLNRAPSLHRYNIVAAFPKLIEGKTIRMNPFVEKGMNLDYDGDQQISHVIIRLSNLDYGQLQANELVWWDARTLDAPDMTARFRTVTGYLDGDRFFVCALEDFPHGILLHEHEHRTFFSVPESIRVIAYDATNARLCLAQPTSWSIHRDRLVEVVTLASGRQIVTDDDPRAIYGVTRELETVLRRPRDGIDIFVPVARHLDALQAPIDTIENPHVPLRQGRDGNISVRLKRMHANMRLTQSFGQLCGMLVGDGWVDTVNGQPKAVHLAAIEPAIQDAYRILVSEQFVDSPSIGHITRKADGYGPDSQKLTVTSMEFAGLMAPLIGHGARNKHLPPFFLTTSKEFRLGLLAGLFDTDGSIAISHGKTRQQWVINHSTTSVRLAQEIVLLYKTLSVSASITATKTPLQRSNWIVSPSTVELHRLGSLPITHAVKRSRFEQFFADTAINAASSSYGRTDIIPVPLHVATAIAALYNRDAMYVTTRKAVKTGRMTRPIAERILSEHPQLQDRSDFTAWCAIVNNKAITWDRVVNVESTEVRETGYDLTVPGFETFMSVDGTILSNTVQVHAPVTPAGIDDARKMTLSHLIFGDKRPGVLNVAPEQDTVLGLHRATQAASDKKTKHFESQEDVMAAYHKGKIELNDPIEIKRL